MRISFFFFISFFPSIIFCQNNSLKHDYIWLTGYDSNPTQLEFGGTVIDFNMDTTEVYYEYRDFDFDISGTTMCNKEGEFIFSCNNKIVANRLNEIMANGSGLNPDPTAFQDRVIQPILSLPFPNNDSIYLLLHQESTFLEIPFDDNIIAIFTLYKTVIDMSWSNDSNISDLGQVIEKNTPIIQDTLTFGRLTATRHANGRDWWILQQEYGSNKFYRFLLNPEGIMEQEAQYEGENQLYETSGVGQAVFSPDGTKYILINSWSGDFPPHIDFFNFNRCDGLLSDFERIELDAEERLRGVVISPNSKYAYLTTSKNYYQIDLDQNSKTLTLIEEVDNSLSRPFAGQLAPNGKIYFASGSTSPNMHIIHNPNEAGLACNLEQHGFPLPTFNRRTIPNHPNYRLSRLIGSPCDTIYNTDTTSVVNTPSYPQTLDVFPNPSSSNINFEISEAATFKITDYLGRTVLEGRVRSGENALDVSGLVSGVYFLTLEGDVSWVARFVVQRE